MAQALKIGNVRQPIGHVSVRINHGLEPIVGCPCAKPTAASHHRQTACLGAVLREPPRVGGGRHKINGRRPLTNATAPAHHKGDRRLHVRREAAGECRRLTSPDQRRQFCITPVLETREGAKRCGAPSEALAERLHCTFQNAALCNFDVAVDHQ